MNLEQIVKDFERDGVVRVNQLLSSEEVESVRRAIADYVCDIAPKLAASEVTFEADGKSARNLWRMEKHSPFFEEISRKSDVVDLVRQLLHDDPIAMGVETFNKPALIGSGVPPHQDNAYFCQTPPDVLTVWIAMDAATESNGPVFYVRGSHKLGVLRHEASGVKGNSMVLANKPDCRDPFVGLLEPGDALIHHCQTIHYSGPNRTDMPRCGLLIVYRASHTQTDPVMKAAYEPALALVSQA